MRSCLTHLLILFYFGLKAQDVNTFNANREKHGRWLTYDTTFCNKENPDDLIEGDESTYQCGDSAMIITTSTGSYNNGIKYGEWLTVREIYNVSTTCKCILNVIDDYSLSKTIELFKEGICMDSRLFIQKLNDSGMLPKRMVYFSNNKDSIIDEYYFNGERFYRTAYYTAGDCGRKEHFKKPMIYQIGTDDIRVACNKTQVTWNSDGSQTRSYVNYTTFIQKDTTFDANGRVSSVASYPVISSEEYGYGVAEKYFLSPNYFFDFSLRFNVNDYYLKEYSADGELIYEEYLDSSYLNFSQVAAKANTIRCDFGEPGLLNYIYPDSIARREFYVVSKKYLRGKIVEESRLPMVFLGDNNGNELAKIDLFGNTGIIGEFNWFYDPEFIDSSLLACYQWKYDSEGKVIEHDYTVLLNGKLTHITEDKAGKIINESPIIYQLKEYIFGITVYKFSNNLYSPKKYDCSEKLVPLNK